jgi:hypothetical protein
MRFRNAVSAAVLLTLPLACGKSSSGSGSFQVPAGGGFGVAFLSPSNGTGEVSRTTQINIVFTHAPAAASLNPAYFTLASPLGEVPVSLSMSGFTVTLIPIKPLVPGAFHEAKVSKFVRAESGESLEKDVTWFFTTKGYGWTPEEYLELTFGEVTDPQVAMNSDGDAIVAWTQEEGTFRGAYARIYTLKSGWEDVETLDPGDPEPDLWPQVGMDDSGTALLIWMDGPDPMVRLRGRRFDRATGWIPAETVDPQAYSNPPPRIEMTPQGSAIAFYGGYSNVIGGSPVWNGFHRLYEPGAGWQERNTEPISYPRNPSQTQWNENFDVALTPSGETVLARSLWNLSTVYSPDNNLQGYRYIGSTLEKYDYPAMFDDRPNRFRLAASDLDTWMLIWQPDDTNVFYIARFLVEIGWLPAYPLAVQGTLTRDHELACDAAGNALHVWTETNGALTGFRHRTFDVESNLWSMVGTGPQHSGNVAGMQMKMTADGIAHLVWAEFLAGRWVIRGSRYVSSSWTQPVTIGQHASFDSINPRLAINSEGLATVVWLRSDGTTFSLMASRYE